MSRYTPSFPQPRILTEDDDIRFVELSAKYQGDTYWSSVQRTEAAFTTERKTIIYQLTDVDAPRKQELSAQEMTNLITGYLTYLADKDLAAYDQQLIDAFTAYVHAAEQSAQKYSQEDDALSELDDHPF